MDECLPKIKVEGLAAAETGSFIETPLTEGCSSEAVLLQVKTTRTNLGSAQG